MQRRHDTGFTLLELCFGLAVVAILAGLAVPGFRASLRAGAVRAAAYELMAGVQQTRGNSVVESRTGILCLADAAGCLAAGPARAWRAFLEVDGQSAGLAIHALPRGIVLRASRPVVRFWPNALAASTVTLTICDESGVARPRAIVISQSGRARFATPAGGG